MATTAVKRTQREVILPSEVVERIKSNSETEKQAAIGLQLAHAIYSRAVFQKFDLHEFFDVPFQTLRGVEYKYFNYLHLLKGVIEFNGSWQAKNGNGQCQKAKFIVGGYHLTDFAAVPMATKPTKPTNDLEAAAASVYKRLSIKIGNEVLTSKTPFFRASLILSKFLTATFTEQYFKENGKHLKAINAEERLQIGEWQFDEKMKSWYVAKRFYEKNGKKYAITATGKNYKNDCAYTDALPLRYKNLYVTGVTDLKQFIDKKLGDIQTSAFFTLNAIRTGDYLPHRNDTNTRLDSAFTALPNILSKNIFLDGQPLIFKDLANSQFNILARLIQNSFEGKSHFADINTTNFVKIVQNFQMSGDVAEFRDAAASGQLYEKFATLANKILYEKFADKQGLNRNDEVLCKDFAIKNGLSRDDAKPIFMFVAFSKPNTPHHFKKVFAETYPSVFAIIQKFKKEYGHEQLPILLQRIESSIFVDHILSDCLKNRLSVLTKHDSIYFVQSEQNKVLSIVNKHLDRHLVQYDLKPK